MDSVAWIPFEPLRMQLQRVLCAFRGALPDDLVGVYLHGSLAMACFNPQRSDVDLLVVTRRGMPVTTKRSVMEALLRHSGDPRPIEISFLRREDLDPWQHPAPFDLHYGEELRERCQAELASGVWERWNDLADRPTDADLAAHITITRHRGVCLYGSPIGEIFPAVPREDYVASIMADSEWARERLAANPVYAVLNLCRVYWYLREERISSKAEAGEWALEFLPSDHRGVIAQALAIYRGEAQDERFEARRLERFIDDVGAAVRDLLPDPVPD